ncbi:MAG: HAMP domain-containing sensor histidine kinase [Alphaproteobacteria bacterium]|nr:HAMP domain-containing sensor histidine kinase [Alphaproteobacteria bacterium]
MPRPVLLRSLSSRLVIGGALWIAVALGGAGLLLDTLFRDHVTRTFDTRLQVLLETLIAAAEVDEAGVLSVAALPGEPRFAHPYSGWYWQIDGPEGAVARSRSLWDWTLALAPVGAGTATGPEEQTLRLLARDIALPGARSGHRFVVAADTADLAAETRPFRLALALALAVLGLGLAAALLAQVRYGLRPLAAVRAALVEVRGGKAQRLGGDFPREVAPLAAEVDALLDHNRSLVERARQEAGNLAHALKTPLTVLGNAADGEDAELGDAVRTQVEAMRRHVDHHLARARAAGSTGAAAGVVPLDEVLSSLEATLAMLHQDRDVALSVRLNGAPAFRGERHDLEEMLGNLMDNACKWASAKVTVRAGAAGEGRLSVTVDDDGPGLSEPERAAALARGRRLDESAPGDGLGLAIVDDLVALYGGALTLATSPLGGLSARLELPASA